MKKLIYFLSLISIISIVLCGCSVEDTTNSRQEKVVKEIEYLDTQIVGMLNKLNNISFENYTVNSKQITLNDNSEKTSEGVTSNEKPQESENNTVTVTDMVSDTIDVANTNNIDWNFLKNEVELLNSSWAIIILDLYNMNVNNDNILAFSTDLDACIIHIKNEDKKNSLISLAKLYSYIPKYLTDIPGENNNQHRKQTKLYILNAYALVEQRNWAEIAKNMEEADNSFKNILNNLDYMENNEFKVNKTYVLLKELENSIGIRDAQIFYMKYKNVMESLNTL